MSFFQNFWRLRRRKPVLYRIFRRLRCRKPVTYWFWSPPPPLAGPPIASLIGTLADENKIRIMIKNSKLSNFYPILEIFSDFFFKKIAFSSLLDLTDFLRYFFGKIFEGRIFSFPMKLIFFQYIEEKPRWQVFWRRRWNLYMGHFEDHFCE